MQMFLKMQARCICQRQVTLVKPATKMVKVTLVGRSRVVTQTPFKPEKIKILLYPLPIDRQGPTGPPAVVLCQR
jgi:hypothetical protein